MASVSGVAETIKALEGLKKSTARGVIERVLKKSAAPIAGAAKSAAPVLTGALRKSIGTKIIRNSAGKRAFAKAMSEGATTAEAGAAARSANRAAGGAGLTAIARISATAPHSPLVEFGTVKAPAQPFLGPAFRGAKEGAFAEISTDIQREISATTKRVAARAAKKAAS